MDWVWLIAVNAVMSFVIGCLTGSIVSKIYIRRWRRELREGRYPCRHDVEWRAQALSSSHTKSIQLDDTHTVPCRLRLRAGNASDHRYCECTCHAAVY